jgi:4-hydroxy-tetrahydrodipicolinate synthase
MVDAALLNDMATARRLNEALLDVHPHLYAEGNPAGIKGALEILGFCSRETRLPLIALSEAGQEALRQAMSQVPAFQPDLMGC